MELKTKLVAAGIGVIALSGSVLGAAFSTSASAAPSPAPAVSTTVGQAGTTATSHDTQATLSTPDTTAPDTTAPDTTASGTNTPGTARAGDPTGSDAAAGTGESTVSETDGPGGHQDINNVDVNHDFQGQE